MNHIPSLVVLLAWGMPQISNSASASNLTEAQISGEQIIEKYLVAIGGRQSLDKIKTLSLLGFIDKNKKTYEVEEIFKFPDKYRYNEQNEDPLSDMSEDMSIGFDGKQAWMLKGDKGAKELEKTAKNVYLLRALPWWHHWKSFFDSVEYKGQVDVGGSPAHQVRMISKTDLPIVAYFDVKTSLLVRKEMEWETLGLKSLRRIDYSDYRKEGAIMLPFKATVSDMAKNGKGQPTYTESYELAKARFNEPISDTSFSLEANKPPTDSRFDPVVVQADPIVKSPSSAEKDGEQIMEKFIQATGGRESWDSIKTLSFKLVVQDSPTDNTYKEVYFKAPNLVRYNHYILKLKGLKRALDLAISGDEFEGYDGQHTWRKTNSSRSTLHLDEQSKEYLIGLSKINPWLTWKDTYVAAKLMKRLTLKGRPVIQVSLASKDGSMSQAFFDPDTSLLVQLDKAFKGATGKDKICRITYGDYKKVDGLVFAHLIQHYYFDPKDYPKGNEDDWHISIYKSLEINKPIDESLFKPVE